MSKLIPPPWDEMLGEHYWKSLDKNQLWMWLSAIASAKSHNQSLEDSISANGTEDELFLCPSSSKDLDSKYGPSLTWLDIFGKGEALSREQGCVTDESLSALGAWCLMGLKVLLPPKKRG